MIIGFSGKMGSGKDFAGDMFKKIVSGWDLVEGTGWIQKRSPKISNFETKKFAGVLKDNVCSLLGVSREKLEDRDYKNTPLGEEWWYWEETCDSGKTRIYSFNGGFIPDGNNFELIKPTPRLILQKLGTEGVRNVIHPDAWVNATMADYNESKNWVITDLRFKNELRGVMNVGGITIRLVRGEQNTGDHPSEIDLDDCLGLFDYVIDNNGDEHDLFRTLYQICMDFNLI